MCVVCCYQLDVMTDTVDGWPIFLYLCACAWSNAGGGLDGQINFHSKERQKRGPMAQMLQILLHKLSNGLSNISIYSFSFSVLTVVLTVI